MSGPRRGKLAVLAGVVMALAGCGGMPDAADGGNVTACADGHCEIRVGAGAQIPVPADFMVFAVGVQTVASDSVTIVGDDSGDSSSGGCYGGCDGSSNNGSFTYVLKKDGTGVENGLSVTLEGVDGKHAVLKVAPA